MTVPNYNDTTLSKSEQTELEAAVLRRLLAHLDANPEVQNIDLMNLAGFCRNCLSRWMDEAAAELGKPLGKAQARKVIYGVDFEEWKRLYQTEATEEARAAFERRDHIAHGSDFDPKIAQHERQNSKK